MIVKTKLCSDIFTCIIENDRGNLGGTNIKGNKDATKEMAYRSFLPMICMVLLQLKYCF